MSLPEPQSQLRSDLYLPTQLEMNIALHRRNQPTFPRDYQPNLGSFEDHLLQRITCFIQNQADLSHFAMACKKFHAIANPVLWRCPMLNNVETFQKFHRELKHSEKLAKKVVVLDLTAKKRVEEFSFESHFESIIGLRQIKENDTEKSLWADKTAIMTESRLCLNLERLKCYGWNLQEEDIEQLADILARLTHLSLVGCQLSLQMQLNEMQLNEMQLNDLPRRLNHIKLLHLDGEFALSDAFAYGLVHHCQTLESLHLWSSGVTYIGFKMLAMGLGQLKELALFRCPRLEDTNVEQFATECRKLAKVSFSECSALSVKSLASILVCCQNLVSLDLRLSQSRRTPIDPAIRWDPPASRYINKLTLKNLPIQDQHLESVISGCSSLRTIGLWSCPDVTDQALRSVFQHTDKLMAVHLIECVHLTETFLNNVAENGKDLVVLVFEKCGQMQPRAIQKIARNCHHLGRLEIHGYANILQSTIYQYSKESRGKIVNDKLHCTLLKDGLDAVAKASVIISLGPACFPDHNADQSSNHRSGCSNCSNMVERDVAGRYTKQLMEDSEKVDSRQAYDSEANSGSKRSDFEDDESDADEDSMEEGRRGRKRVLSKTHRLHPNDTALTIPRRTPSPGQESGQSRPNPASACQSPVGLRDVKGKGRGSGSFSGIHDKDLVLDTSLQISPQEATESWVESTAESLWGTLQFQSPRSSTQPVAANLNKETRELESRAAYWAATSSMMGSAAVAKMHRHNPNEGWGALPVNPIAPYNAHSDKYQNEVLNSQQQAEFWRETDGRWEMLQVGRNVQRGRGNDSENDWRSSERRRQNQLPRSPRLQKQRRQQQEDEESVKDIANLDEVIRNLGDEDQHELKSETKDKEEPKAKPMDADLLRLSIEPLQSESLVTVDEPHLPVNNRNTSPPKAFQANTWCEEGVWRQPLSKRESFTSSTTHTTSPPLPVTVRRKAEPLLLDIESSPAPVSAAPSSPAMTATNRFDRLDLATPRSGVSSVKTSATPAPSVSTRHAVQEASLLDSVESISFLDRASMQVAIRKSGSVDTWLWDDEPVQLVSVAERDLDVAAGSDRQSVGKENRSVLISTSKPPALAARPASLILQPTVLRWDSLLDTNMVSDEPLLQPIVAPTIVHHANSAGTTHDSLKAESLDLNATSALPVNTALKSSILEVDASALTPKAVDALPSPLLVQAEQKTACMPSPLPTIDVNSWISELSNLKKKNLEQQQKENRGQWQVMMKKQKSDSLALQEMIAAVGTLSKPSSPLLVSSDVSGELFSTLKQPLITTADEDELQPLVVSGNVQRTTTMNNDKDLMKLTPNAVKATLAMACESDIPTTVITVPESILCLASPPFDHYAGVSSTEMKARESSFSPTATSVATATSTLDLSADAHATDDQHSKPTHPKLLVQQQVCSPEVQLFSGREPTSSSTPSTSSAAASYSTTTFQKSPLTSLGNATVTTISFPFELDIGTRIFGKRKLLVLSEDPRPEIHEFCSKYEMLDYEAAVNHNVVELIEKRKSVLY